MSYNSQSGAWHSNNKEIRATIKKVLERAKTLPNILLPRISGDFIFKRELKLNTSSCIVKNIEF